MMSEADRQLKIQEEEEARRKRAEDEAWRWWEYPGTCWHEWQRQDTPQGGYRCRICGGWKPTL